MLIAVIATVLSIFTSNPSYRHWANTYAVDLPKVSNVQVINGECPGEKDAIGCVYNDKPTVIYMVKPDRLVFAHELGHVYDFTTMTNGQRSAFRRIMKYRQPWRSTGDGPTRVIGVDELFATAYQECATAWAVQGGYNYHPTPRQTYRVCRLLRKR